MEVQARKTAQQRRAASGNGTTKNPTFHQSHETNQLKKKRRGKPNQTTSVQESSHAVTARLEMEEA
jgi:hypothetical protein